jgi:hypothetical protein
MFSCKSIKKLEALTVHYFYLMVMMPALHVALTDGVNSCSAGDMVVSSPSSERASPGSHVNSSNT